MRYFPYNFYFPPSPISCDTDPHLAGETWVGFPVLLEIDCAQFRGGSVEDISATCVVEDLLRCRVHLLPQSQFLSFSVPCKPCMTTTFQRNGFAKLELRCFGVVALAW